MGARSGTFTEPGGVAAPTVVERDDLVELRRSNRDLEELSHVMAHALREPLRGLRLLVGMIEEDHPRLDDAVAVRLRRIGELSARASRLVEALARYARAGSGELRPETLPLGELVADALLLLGEEPAGTGPVSVVAPLPAIRCDRALASSLLAELISNGLRHNVSSSRRVEIGADTGPGGEPVVLVRDNGVGMDPDLLRDGRAFLRHPAISNGSAAEPGVGLSIAKRIVERHHGRLWARPGPEGGTAVFFTLGGDAGAS